MTLKLDDFEPVAKTLHEVTNTSYAYVKVNDRSISANSDLYHASQLQQLINQCNAKDVEIAKLNRGSEDIGKELIKEQELNSTLLLERNQLATLQTQNAELLADAERYRNIKPIIDQFPEINPSNYDHDDVCHLNAWGVELVLSDAAKAKEGE